jgi:diguanylate cyclase (GGDEF)-like protein/PAS domain S-box-containing protein
MATAGAHGFALELSARLAIVEDLLVSNPTAAVGVFDAAHNLVDAGPALAKVGIRVDGHPPLQTGLLAEFLALSDVWLLSDVALEAGVHGAAMRPVRLRDNQRADLHLIEINDTALTSVAILVPHSGSITGTPTPTAVAASSRVGVVQCDGFGIIMSASAATRGLLGRPNEPIEGTAVVHLLHPDDQEVAIANWSAAKEQRGVALRWRCRVVRDDGSALWVEITITNEIDADGQGGVRFDLYDISREVAATEALLAERQLLELLTETLPVGVAKFDAFGCLEHANGRLRDLLAPLDPQAVLDEAFRGELTDPDLAAAFVALRQDGIGSRQVVDHDDDDGTVRHLEWTIRAARSDDGTVTGGALCIADVTEAAQLRDALEQRARTDGLTGCLNRSGTIGALEHALANIGSVEGVGLLFIDLDGFKSINDSRGHAIGDAVLEVVARRLRSAVRTGDLVGRLGGDEFVVISPGLQSAGAAVEFAGRVSQQLQGPAVIDGVPAPITASVGVAWTSTATAGELLNAADGAMYTAKQTHSAEPVLSAASGTPT